MNWQPIETAPKDRWILLTGGTPSPHWGDMNPPKCIACIWNDRYSEWVCSSYDAHMTIAYENPTYWMELPEPQEAV